MGNAEVMWSGPERVPSMLCLVEMPLSILPQPRELDQDWGASKNSRNS